jgi:hypothetical protein
MKEGEMGDLYSVHGKIQNAYEISFEGLSGNWE